MILRLFKIQRWVLPFVLLTFSWLTINFITSCFGIDCRFPIPFWLTLLLYAPSIIAFLGLILSRSNHQQGPLFQVIALILVELILFGSTVFVGDFELGMLTPIIIISLPFWLFLFIAIMAYRALKSS